MSVIDDMDHAEVFGVPVPDLPKGSVAVDAVVLIKGFNGAGDIKHWDLRSRNLTLQEALGMAISAADSIRNMLAAGCTCGDDH